MKKGIVSVVSMLTGVDVGAGTVGKMSSDKTQKIEAVKSEYLWGK